MKPLTILHSNKGQVSFTAILVGLALLGVLFSGLMDTMSLMNRAQKSVSESANVGELERGMSLTLRNTAACTCIFTTPSVAFPTTPPYTFNTTNLPAGVQDGAAIRPAPLTISTWDAACTTEGKVFGTSTVGTNNIPNTNSLQINSMQVDNLQPLGPSNYYAEITTTIQKTTNSLGNVLFNYSVPVIFSVTLTGAIATITGCVDQFQAAESRYIAATAGTAVQFIPLNDVTNPGAFLTLQLNDGIFRSTRINIAAGSYDATIMGTDLGFPGLPTPAPDQWVGPWYYVYAIPRVPPHPLGTGPSLNTQALAFIASQNPPWVGPGGGYANLPYRYLTAATFQAGGVPDPIIHDGSDQFFFGNSVDVNSNPIGVPNGDIAQTTINMPVPLSATAVVIDFGLTVYPDSKSGIYQQGVHPTHNIPADLNQYLFKNWIWHHSDQSKDFTPGPSPFTVADNASRNRTHNTVVPLIRGTGVKAIYYESASPSGSLSPDWGVQYIGVKGYIDAHAIGN